MSKVMQIFSKRPSLILGAFLNFFETKRFGVRFNADIEHAQVCYNNFNWFRWSGVEMCQVDGPPACTDNDDTENR